MLPDNSMPVEVVISLPEVVPAVKPHLPMAQSSTEIPACMAAGHSTLLCDDISYLVRDQLPLNQCYYVYVVLWSNVFFQMQCPVFWYCISCCTSTFGQFFFPQTRKKPPHAMWFARGGGGSSYGTNEVLFLISCRTFFWFRQSALDVTNWWKCKAAPGFAWVLSHHPQRSCPHSQTDRGRNAGIYNGRFVHPIQVTLSLVEDISRCTWASKLRPLTLDFVSDSAWKMRKFPYSFCSILSV